MAIVTGANRGIGLGIAEVCLANSANVVYSLDIQEPGEEFLALQKRGANLRFIQTDVTIEDRVRQAVDTIISEQGRIDGFVANAGMTKHQPALQFDREQLEQLFNLNVCILRLHSAPFGGHADEIVRSSAPISALISSPANSLSLGSKDP